MKGQRAPQELLKRGCDTARTSARQRSDADRAYCRPFGLVLGSRRVHECTLLIKRLFDRDAPELKAMRLGRSTHRRLALVATVVCLLAKIDPADDDAVPTVTALGAGVVCRRTEREPEEVDHGRRG